MDEILHTSLAGEFLNEHMTGISEHIFLSRELVPANCSEISLQTALTAPDQGKK